jgi:hypothetical protein
MIRPYPATSGILQLLILLFNSLLLLTHGYNLPGVTVSSFNDGDTVPILSSSSS